MRALKRAPTPPARRPTKRPRSINNDQGRPLNYLALLDLLRNHLKRELTDNHEAADDLMNVAKKLSEVEIPPTGQRKAIRYLESLDARRSNIGWPEVEQDLHQILSRLITRLKHTHPRRLPLHLPTAATLKPPTREPFYVLALRVIEGTCMAGNTDAGLSEIGRARHEAVMSLLCGAAIDIRDAPLVMKKARALQRSYPRMARDFDWLIHRLTTELEEHRR